MLLQIISLIIGALIFSFVIAVKKTDIEDNPLFVIIIVSAILVAFVGYLSAGQSNAYSIEKNIDNFSFYKFKSRVVIVTEDNALWSYTDMFLNHSLNNNSKVKLRIYYNYFNTVNEKKLIVDGREY